MNTDKNKKINLDEKRISEMESSNNENTVNLKATEELISKVNERKHDSVSEQEGSEVSVTRRALIKAGWAIPVILSIALPVGDVFVHASTGGSSPGSPGSPLSGLDDTG